MYPYSKYKSHLLYPDKVSRRSCNIIVKYETFEGYYFKSINEDMSFAIWDYALGKKIRINSGGNVANR